MIFLKLSCSNLMNMIKGKWLVISIYRSPSQIREFLLNNLTKMIDFYVITYDNYLIMSDFNMEPSDSSLK